MVTLAGSYQISPVLTLLAEAQWTNWSVVKNLQVLRTDGSVVTQQPEQWHGTWFGSIWGELFPYRELDNSRRLCI